MRESERSMVFEVGDEVFDSDDMVTPMFEDAFVMRAYITKDYRRVFGAYMHWDGIRIRDLQGELLKSLAERVKNEELMRAALCEGGNGDC